MADDIETISAKLPPGQRSKLQEAVSEAISANTARARQALKNRRERAMQSQHEGNMGAIVAAGGGAAAEGMRRKLIGRFVESTRGQALGLLGAGAAVKWLGSSAELPYLEAIGNAHCAVAGMVASTELYGTKDDPDPLQKALEATTHKAIHKSDKD